MPPFLSAPSTNPKNLGKQHSNLHAQQTTLLLTDLKMDFLIALDRLDLVRK